MDDDGNTLNFMSSRPFLYSLPVPSLIRFSHNNFLQVSYIKSQAPVIL